MNKHILLVALMVSLLTFNLFANSFMSTDTKTLAGEKVNFPDFALEPRPVLFALAMGTSKESGEIQQEQLLEWQKLLQTHNSLKHVSFYHFPVIDAPGFIQGVIRRGITKSYSGLVQLEKAAVIFIKDTKAFANQAHIPLDDQATIAVVLPNGTMSGYIKGPPSEQALEELIRKLQ